MSERLKNWKEERIVMKGEGRRKEEKLQEMEERKERNKRRRKKNQIEKGKEYGDKVS